MVNISDQFIKTLSKAVLTFLFSLLGEAESKSVEEGNVSAEKSDPQTVSVFTRAHMLLILNCLI